MHQVYFVKAENYIKIGVTSGSVEGRLIFFRTGCPFKLELLKTIEFPDREEAMKAEKLFHRLFRLHKKHNEWFHDDDFFVEVMALLDKQPYNDLEENLKLGATAVDILGDSHKFDGVFLESECVGYGDGGMLLSCFRNPIRGKNSAGKTCWTFS